ncbi:MAG TPA: hypothetical protein VD736_02410 [Nitrososphaera sp.]|nr:hypothetical protein [Nitrososphaera sp.]
MTNKLLALGIAATVALALTSFIASPHLWTNTFAQVSNLVFVENPNNNPVRTACPPNLIKHWDKIVFFWQGSANIDVIEGDAQHPNLPVISPNKLYDIKVLDKPTEVADLRFKIFQKIDELGYDMNWVLEEQFHIEDVEYAIVCQAPKSDPVPPQ